tara:strand:- start:921 stop:1160 length:240 start_codon:yes stop_codon:yes gene_type:complete
MLIYVSKDRLLKLLTEEVDAWMSVGGGPNLNAFRFDPESVDKAELERLGFYDNREAWLAGVRINELMEYYNEIKDRGIA